ncbi:MAG: mechanosensitive ion channel domain-containing protein [Aeoliella sp.]
MWTAATLRMLLLAALLWAQGRCSSAQDTTPTGVTGPMLTAADAANATAEPSLADEREVLAERLRVAQRALPADDSPDVPEPTSREVELLKQKDLILAQQETAVERRKELGRERGDVEAKLNELRQNGLSEERPFSFLLLETFNDLLAAENHRLEARQSATEAATEAAERAKKGAEDQAKARRRAQEQAAIKQEAARSGELALAASIAKLESELADAVLHLRLAELGNRRYDEATKALTVTLHEEKIALVEEDVTFTASDLDQQLIEIDRQEQTINGEIESNQLARQYLDQQWSDARRRLDESSDPPAELEAEVEARGIARGLRAEQTQWLGDQLQWHAPMRQSWQRRFRIATGNFSTGDLHEWQDTAQGLIDELDYERRLIDARIDGLRSNLAAVDRQLKGVGEDEAQARRWLRDQQRTLRTSVQFYNDTYIRLEAAAGLHEKLIGEVDRRTHRFSFQQWAAVYWQRVADIWSYELTSSDNNPITIGKVVLGILLLVLGVAISKQLSRFLGHRFLPRFGVQEGAAHSLGSLAFYAFAFCAALMALRLVNVPLTFFTFLGGALAIGVGFGSQKPINDFLSGLILLTERPMRVGDMIHVAPSTGTQITGIIEAVGTRSTRLRSDSNLEIILPNSALLENNVSNWTLSDPTIRTSVSVGVVYGSPTDKVVEILLQVADGHLRVLDAPEPFVWLTAFGDNSLDFELHFFVVFRNRTEQQRIQSELRLEIDRRFREAEIGIAFPQNDVHLDTVKPLEIRVARPPLEVRRRSA